MKLPGLDLRKLAVILALTLLAWALVLGLLLLALWAGASIVRSF